MNNFKNAPCAILSKVAACLVIAVAVFAPSIAGAVSVSPVRIELDADPGTSLSSSFKVFNDKAEETTLYVNAARFETKDETGEPAFVPGKQGLPSWISSTPSVTVPGKSFRDINFTITVPKDATPGGYFASLFVSPVAPSANDTDNDIALRSQVGTILLFRVNGDFKEGETVLEFDTKDRKRFYNTLPVEFYYRFQNVGDDRAKPLGDITIKNIFGKVVKGVNANRSAGNTLPKSIRRYDAVWNTAGREKAETNLDSPQYLDENAGWIDTIKWQWNHFAVGYYSANLQVTVNNDSARSYTAKTGFWVFPWQLLLTCAVIIFLLVWRRDWRKIFRWFRRGKTTKQ